MARIKIIVGHFGSGKTEIALNMALASSGEAAVVDLDIVNPYFRAGDARKLLSDRGIRVIAPEFANTNVDIPVLSGDILSVFESRETVFFDVGGDGDGALALGGFKRFFEREGYEMYCVINARRPLTRTVADILGYIADIEGASRLRVTGLINNTNLAGLTDPELVHGGALLCEEAAKSAGIPVIFTAAKRELAPDIKGKVMALDLFLDHPLD